MISEVQIREQLARYLRKESSLDQLEDWLVQRSWNMHRDSADAAQKLAAAVELRLAEHSSGHLDEPSLREELRNFLNPSVIRISFGAAQQSQVEGEATNILVFGKTQVIAFTAEAAAPPQGGPSLGGVVSFDREQLVGRG
ncbi:MAG: hypothetical protein L0387_24940 [Acidobacteria bacterium]|nr:hypothetical protein [Acidobacteriota bacterium]